MGSSRIVGYTYVHLAEYQVITDVPDAVKRRHDSDEEDIIPEGFGNKPEAHDYPNGDQDGQDRQPILLAWKSVSASSNDDGSRKMLLTPPQHKQEAHA